MRLTPCGALGSWDLREVGEETEVCRASRTSWDPRASEMRPCCGGLMGDHLGRGDGAQGQREGRRTGPEGGHGGQTLCCRRSPRSQGGGPWVSSLFLPRSQAQRGSDRPRLHSLGEVWPGEAAPGGALRQARGDEEAAGMRRPRWTAAGSAKGQVGAAPPGPCPCRSGAGTSSAGEAAAGCWFLGHAALQGSTPGRGPWSQHSMALTWVLPTPRVILSRGHSSASGQTPRGR